MSILDIHKFHECSQVLLCPLIMHIFGFGLLTKRYRFKEYSLEVRAELPQTKVADSQPSLRAGRPEGLVEQG